MATRVYIETTIPSAYFNTRPDPESVARQNWTREWWDRRRSLYEIVTSDAVLEELSRGTLEIKTSRLELLASIPWVEMTPRVEEVAAIYIQRRLMPADAQGDALHLALASVHRCDILLTWNCRHLANYNKTAHIRALNLALGLPVPTIITPIELLEGGPDEA